MMNGFPDQVYKHTVCYTILWAKRKQPHSTTDIKSTKGLFTIFSIYVSTTQCNGSLQTDSADQGSGNYVRIIFSIMKRIAILGPLSCHGR